VTASRPPKIAGNHSGRARRGAIKVDEGQRCVGVNNRSGDREATKLRQSPHRPASKRQCFLVGPPAAPAVESMVERIVRGKNLTASTIGAQPMGRATGRPLVYGGIESTNPLYPSKGRKRCLLTGAEGSKPSPSSSESTANPTSSGADDPECFGLQGHGAARPPASAMSNAGDPVGAETGGDVTPFSDNPDIRKRFGIKQDTARQTTVSS
jgi:hypothetical protein